MKDALEMEELKECTFQPNSEKKKSKSLFYLKDKKVETKENVKRLYEEGLHKVIVKKEKANITIDHEYEKNKKDLSFCPQIKTDL